LTILIVGIVGVTILIIGIVGVARSERNKLPIFMSYNTSLQTNGITPKADSSLLILTTSKSSVKKNLLLLYFYIVLFLHSNVIGCKLFLVFA
jgi:hypothetical protein